MAGPMTSSLSVRAIAVALALLLTADEAAAEKKGAQAPPSDPSELAGAIARVKSGDEADVAKGLAEIRAAGAKGVPAAEAVAARLARGLTMSLTEAAIETLADLGSEAGSAAIAKHSLHRNAKIRAAAVRALSRTRGPLAAKVLKKALSDPDPAVRGAAASGLGSVQARDAVPMLMVALERHVGEAAASIGQLCVRDQCAALADKLGALPFVIVTPGLDAMLTRPAADVPDELKVKIVGRIRALGTAESTNFLEDVRARFPKTGSPAVQKALDDSLLGEVR
jgi:hypothetical protein